jgi:hypothetical protein
VKKEELEKEVIIFLMKNILILNKLEFPQFKYIEEIEMKVDKKHTIKKNTTEEV